MILSEKRCPFFGIHALSPPLEFCCLLLIVPPCLWSAARKTGLFRRKTEHVPVGDTMRRQIPVRYPVAAGADHAVEGAARHGEVSSRLGLKDFFEKRLYHRIRNAGEI